MGVFCPEHACEIQVSICFVSFEESMWNARVCA
jgi:hypothetical protein